MAYNLPKTWQQLDEEHSTLLLLHISAKPTTALLFVSLLGHIEDSSTCM